MDEFKTTADGEIWAYIPRFGELTYEDKQKRSEAFDGLLNALEDDAPNEEIQKWQDELKRA